MIIQVPRVHTYIQDVHTYRQTYMQAGRHTYIHTETHTGRQAYIHTDIQKYGHTYNHTYIHTYTRTGIHDEVFTSIWKNDQRCIGIPQRYPVLDPITCLAYRTGTFFFIEPITLLAYRTGIPILNPTI